LAHTHDTHGHHEVDVVDRGAPAGALVAVAALLVLAVIAFALLWTQPWNDDGASTSNPNVPGVSDNGGGGTNDGGGSGGGTNDGGSSGGDQGGGSSGGGEAPAQ
jgi:hypothetical protein